MAAGVAAVARGGVPVVAGLADAALDDPVPAGLDDAGGAAAVARSGVPVVAALAGIDGAVAAHARAFDQAGRAAAAAVVLRRRTARWPGLQHAVAAELDSRRRCSRRRCGCGRRNAAEAAWTEPSPQYSMSDVAAAVAGGGVPSSHCSPAVVIRSRRRTRRAPRRQTASQPSPAVGAVVALLAEPRLEHAVAAELAAAGVVATVAGDGVVVACPPGVAGRRRRRTRRGSGRCTRHRRWCSRRRTAADNDGAVAAGQEASMRQSGLQPSPGALPHRTPPHSRCHAAGGSAGFEPSSPASPSLLAVHDVTVGRRPSSPSDPSAGRRRRRKSSTSRNWQPCCGTSTANFVMVCSSSPPLWD